MATLSLLTVLSRSADHWVPGSTTANGLTFFDAGLEATIPTFLSSLLLLTSAVLAAAIARTDVSMAWRWRMLGLVLMGLALDEASRSTR